MVEGKDTTFQLRNYLDEVVPSTSGPSVRDLASFDIFHTAAQAAADEGELTIDMPSEIAERFSDPSDTSGEQGKSKSFVIRIHYELVQPRGGAYFVLPDATAFPSRLPRNILKPPRHPLVGGLSKTRRFRYVLLK